MWGNKDTRLVGIDKFGNKYFEKPSGTAGRTRWVEYADKKYYNASNVPPEWHGWLHYVTDHTAEQLEDLRPKRYGLEHQPNRTGEGEQYIYHSKGHVLSPNQRDWSRYDPWKKADAAPMS
ncbi:hypothetical protein SELMODRAFT_236885 [Selaginella moellendorffii]|uniref:NADH dehydrogenase [ubiquinone] 1 alpha subcomplex subunit 12 n=2 Tax=Selaginella moellendorffii TaxID=88036 RepID=D8TEK6_SELML|nr:hypothetical protein SELMODRAFT_236885 [Selaginella moellendorffii]